MAAMLVRRRRVSVPVRSSSLRRRSAWATGTTNNEAIPALTGTVFDLLSTFTLSSATATMGTTVARTHLVVRWEPTNLADFLLIGVLVSNQNQEFDDINPLTNESLPWSFITKLYPMANGVTPDGSVFERFDLRAKRKMGPMENRYVLVVANPAGTPRNFSFYSRTLLLLP